MQPSDIGANAALLRTNMKADRPLENIACCQDLPEPKMEMGAKPEFRRGRVLDGRFFILETVSCAGMATIYKAEDMDNHRQKVVVKVPLRKFESDPAFHRRFRCEEEIGLKLNHPSLLKFIPTAESRSRLYLVTEYLEGCTLDYIIHKNRPLPGEDALRIASAIAEAVQAMHEQGVVHNDLKPSNVMICSDQTLRVMDFGLASYASERRGIFGALVPIFGTPEYMAPEQVKARRTDERTDIYCLGVMLFEMLAGRLPFQSDDPWASVNLRVSGDPVAPRSLNPVISVQAEEIVLHAMQRKPADRYQTVAAFRAELDAPEQIQVTGYASRLKAPRWKLSLEKTQLLFGSLLGVGALGLLVMAFFILSNFLGGH
ncbi:MAG TPA: serine/threonine-protein kinase [Opitutaceae bacterium]|nr:serine/threonine-protein kinase [Opitutaceae bacterium]